MYIIYFILIEMKIAILGYARQGISSFDYWNKPGNTITICDQNSDLIVPDGCLAKLGADYMKNLDEFDVIVRTPKLHPAEIVKANPDTPNICAKVTSNTNEFLRICPTRNIIGVTGTKGKGTTSTLIAEMLRANGHTVHLGGNIGTPPLELLKENIQPNDWIVLELANFQLIDCSYSPHISVVLMIDNEHLDWHDSFTDYTAAKENLVLHQLPNDVVIYYGANDISKKVAYKSVGLKIPYLEPNGAHVENGVIVIDNIEICNIADIGLLGEHNIQNICAAITAVWQVHQNVEAIHKVVRDFKTLPYRLEHRQKINGIDYYNDSFSSNPSATIAAIKTITQPTVLILGGKDRGLNLTTLVDEIVQAKHIKAVCLIGEAAPRISAAFQNKSFTNFTNITSNDMAVIVAQASRLASVGDAVILSPGFPSFDMFADFEDRGNKFNTALRALNPYKQFIFDSYTFSQQDNSLALHYRIDNALYFTETYQFQTTITVPENSAAFTRACELLFLMAGVSYYKTYLPPTIVVNNIPIDTTLADFLQKTYQKGLGEFFFVNNLAPDTPIEFPVTVDKLSPAPFTHNQGKLVGIGGGKDSLLSIALLKNDTLVETWACNHQEKLQPLVRKIKTKHTSVLRKWDTQISELNTAGAYNGHVPISAILACAGVVLAALTGKQDIVVSNESSANAPTLIYRGIAINHQYSKSLEFENDFQAILGHLFGNTKRYYSLLRPFTELAIAERFAPYFDTYKDAFCSCNKAFTLASKQMQWCGTCAKCAFTYLVFAPFIATEKLQDLFNGNNLLMQPELHSTYEQLLGINGYKPLECVGEIEECRIAHAMALRKGVESLPFTYDIPANYNYKATQANNIPSDVISYVLP